MTEHVIRPATDTAGRMIHELEQCRDALEADLEHKQDILDVAIAKLVDARRRLERATHAADAAAARLDALTQWEVAGYKRDTPEHATYLNAVADEKRAIEEWRER